jgi:hypothetical protein
MLLSAYPENTSGCPTVLTTTVVLLQVSLPFHLTSHLIWTRSNFDPAYDKVPQEGEVYKEPRKDMSWVSLLSAVRHYSMSEGVNKLVTTGQVATVQHLGSLEQVCRAAQTEHMTGS